MEYRLVASPSALERYGRPKRPADLCAIPMAGLLATQAGAAAPSPVPGVWAFVKGERREELTFAFAVSATDPIVPLDFALRGQGFAILLDALTRRSIETGLLVVALDDWTIADKLELSIIYRRRATSDSKVRVFVDFILNQVRANPQPTT